MPTTIDHPWSGPSTSLSQYIGADAQTAKIAGLSLRLCWPDTTPMVATTTSEGSEIACGDRIVASHQRCYHRGRDVMDPYHYLPALLRKPGAFHQARVVRNYPWPSTFRQALAFLEERHPDGQGIKEFLRILTLKDQVGEERLSRALELALQYRCVAVDAVRHLLHRMESTWQPPLPLDLATVGLTSPEVSLADPSQYNRLLSVA